MGVLVRRFLGIHTFIATRIGAPRNFRRRNNCTWTSGRHKIGGPAHQRRTKLEAIKNVDGAVIYYREDPQQEASDVAMQVMDVVTDLKLPIGLSLEDFD